MPFEKGQKKTGGKQKGYTDATVQTARQRFVEICEGQNENVQSALEEVRKKDPAKYLDIMSKLAQYFVPKKVEQVGETVLRVKTPEDK
jgi:hypothetical protein